LDGFPWEAVRRPKKKSRKTSELVFLDFFLGLPRSSAPRHKMTARLLLYGFIVIDRKMATCSLHLTFSAKVFAAVTNWGLRSKFAILIAKPIC
jgi:hypothetical protein